LHGVGADLSAQRRTLNTTQRKADHLPGGRQERYGSARAWNGASLPKAGPLCLTRPATGLKHGLIKPESSVCIRVYSWFLKTGTRYCAGRQMKFDYGLVLHW